MCFDVALSPELFDATRKACVTGCAAAATSELDELDERRGAERSVLVVLLGVASVDRLEIAEVR